MTHYMHQGSMIRITANANMDVRESLTTGTYSVMMDMKGFFLEKIENMTTSPKVYGDLMTRVDRILTTYMDRSVSTGILLQGEKGSGKTLLAKTMSAKLREMDIPTIVVNAPYSGDDFNTFIQLIDQPCMVFFDEFEKIYDEDAQQRLLTLFDGAFANKKLFVVTTNEAGRISSYMRNRPGRFFYRFEYSGLESQFIRDYAEDLLNDKSQIDTLVTFASMFAAFNFDMLKALVEEMNRYNETVQQAAQYVNAQPFSDKAKYNVVSLKISPEWLSKQKDWDKDDEEIPFTFRKYDPKVSGGDYVSVLSSNNRLYVNLYGASDDQSSHRLYFERDDLVGLQNSEYQYKTEEGHEIVIVKDEYAGFNVMDLL